MVENLNRDRQAEGEGAETGSATPELADSPVRRQRGFAARCCSWLLRGLLLLLVGSTLLLWTGRLLMFALDSQQAHIAGLVAERLGVSVGISGIEGRWTGLYPVLKISGLVLDPDAGTNRTVVDATEVELDLWRSVLRREPVLRGLDVAGLQLRLQQQPDGSWRVPGLAAGEGRTLELLLDLALTTPSISLAESNIDLEFSNGNRVDLGSAFLTVRNNGERHLVALQFRPVGDGAPVLARVDLQGDPRGRFAGTAWMEFDALPLHELQAVAAVDDWELLDARATGTLWSQFDQRGVTMLQGRLEGLLRATIGLPDRDAWPLDLANGSLQFRARRNNEASTEGWLVEVRELGVDLQGSPVYFPSLRLQLPQAADQDWRLDLAQVAIAPLVQAALDSPLPEAARSALATLDPSGDLENLVLVSNRAGTHDDGFDLQANFRGLRVEAWKGAPSGSNLAGYLHASASSGMAELDAREVRMEIPGLFREPWFYDRLNARVSWNIGPDGFRVASSPIHVNSNLLQGVVQFGLDTTQPGWRTRYPELTLLVGMDRMDLGLRAGYLPQLQRIATTMDWLDAALQAGQVTDSLFVLRTPTGGDPALASATHASWFEASDVSLKFLPDWPVAEVGAARVQVQDQSVAIAGSATEIAGIAASRVQGSIASRPEGGSLLELDVEATTAADTGLDFLRETPVRANVGAVLDDWAAQGQLQLDVELDIALGTEPPAPRVAVRAVTEGASLYLQDRALLVEEIGGVLQYTSEVGLQAEDLAARLFGATAQVDISTQSGEPRSIRIDSEGEASIAALESWAGQPDFVRRLLAHLEGSFSYTASLELPTGGSTAPSRLNLSSDLLGVVSSFPTPFAKDAGTASRLDMELAFNADGSDLQLRYGAGLSGQIRLDAAGVDRGYLYLGPLNEDFTIRQTDSSAEGLLVSGRLEALDYDSWEALVPELETGGGKGLKDYLRLVDVDLGQLSVRGQELTDINVQVQYSDQAWRIQARNTLLAGALVIPQITAEPWNVDLEYLRLPPREVPEPGMEAEEVDVLEGVDPARLPAFDFVTAELAIGEHQLGSWQFRFRPRADGADIRDLRMEEAQSRISGRASAPPDAAGDQELSGASMAWDHAGGVHESRFEGIFAAADLSRVMPLWGHDANIVSRRAEFDGSLSWPGSPLAFSLRKASGSLDMAIDSGRFVDIDSGSSRLLGAFNFDALVRRLELDFSDLYQRGFTFDDIRGELDFVDGVVHTRSPLVIDGPSSQLTITGEIDLASETIMADMLVRIPLGENISLLAGLLGAWPIAVSTYLASKIFAEQVEDFTTVIYRLEGPWANPRAGFEAPEESTDP